MKEIIEILSGEFYGLFCGIFGCVIDSILMITLFGKKKYSYILPVMLGLRFVIYNVGLLLIANHFYGGQQWFRLMMSTIASASTFLIMFLTTFLWKEQLAKVLLGFCLCDFGGTAIVYGVPSLGFHPVVNAILSIIIFLIIYKIITPLLKKYQNYRIKHSYICSEILIVLILSGWLSNFLYVSIEDSVAAQDTMLHKMGIYFSIMVALSVTVVFFIYSIQLSRRKKQLMYATEQMESYYSKVTIQVNELQEFHQDVEEGFEEILKTKKAGTVKEKKQSILAYTPCEDYSCSYLSLSSYEEKCPEEKEEVQTNEIIREQMQSEFISDEEAELWGFPEEKVNSVEGERAYYIAVVADGHGDSDCVRSQIGSQFIVEVVTECMKGFADGYYEDPFMFKSNVCGRKYHLRHITDTIVSQWNDRVKNHLSENPLTEEEIVKLSPKAADAYKNKKALSHLYGTTVIGSLLIDSFLILIQQGDGRCEVFYENGKVEQPIPWDERCFGNVTTSMCDSDVNERFRYCYIDLKQNPVSACFVGTDGIEDSYRNMEGTHMFYRNRCLEMINDKIEEYENGLSDTLSQLSRQGSGDDVSIAGIIWLDKLVVLKELFIRQNKKYPLEAFIVSNENKLISMERKYDFLREEQDRTENEYNKLQKQYDVLNEEHEKLNQHCQDIEKRLKELEDDIQTGERDSAHIFDEDAMYLRRYDEFLSELHKQIFSRNIKDIVDSFFEPLEKLSGRFTEVWERKKCDEQQKITKLKGELQSTIEKMQNIYKKMEILQLKVDEVKQKRDEAYRQFNEYDLKNKQIKESLENAKRELEQLNELG